MPLGSPLPPPPRLSWPGPRCLPRTIMPPTAAGTESRVAAAGGPASRGGPRPAASSSGRCVARGNREPGHGRLLVRAPLHQPTSKVPAARLSPPSWAWAAGPPERRGRDGEAGSCPSFLPSFEIKILCSYRSAGGGPGRLCCQPLRCGDPAQQRTWASGAATPPDGTGWRRRPELTPGGARPHLLLRLLGRWAATGPRAWLALWRPRGVSRAGGCNAGCWAAAPSRLAVQSARPGAAAARPPRLNGLRLATGCRGDSISVSPQSPRAPRIRRPGVVGSEGERGVAEADPGPDSCHVCQPATSERPLSN